MTKQKNNIRIIFTDKANFILNGIIKNFNLEEPPEEFIKKIKEGKPSNLITIDRLIKNFVSQDMSEKDLISLLQRDLGLSLQIANEIAKEIINKIVPLLEKVPEEKFKDPTFREEISKKIWKDKKAEQGNEEVRETDIFQKIKPPMGVAEILEKNTITEEQRRRTTSLSKKTEKIKKPIISEEAKESIIKTRQPKKQDVYREPIE